MAGSGWKLTTRGGLLVLALVAASALAILGLGACGGSGDAKKLLQETFSGAHAIRSGNLSFTLNVNPSGSSTLTGPITLGFSGPFQSRGAGKLPASDFNLSLSGMGHSTSIGIVSTGTTGYVTLTGASYQLPDATFRRLESSFSGLSAAPGTSGSGALAKLGINPLHWLINPRILGQEDVGGAHTSHIRASINVSALLTDLNAFLRNAGNLGAQAGSLSGGLSAANRAKIAREVQSPTVDVWTGQDDKTLRRLTLGLTVPVTGQISNLLGGLRSAQVAVDMQYSDLGRPQSITAPTNVRPFSEFQTKLQSFLATLQGATGGAASTAIPGTGAGGASGSTPETGSTGSGSSSASGSSSGGAAAGGDTSARVKAYAACLQAAGQDVTKMQGCAAILNGR